MVVVSRVTAPLRASRRPETEVPVCAVMEVSANRSPTKLLSVPRVAEEPTCQTTWHGSAPLMSSTRLPEAVINVDAV